MYLFLHGLAIIPLIIPGLALSHERQRSKYSKKNLIKLPHVLPLIYHDHSSPQIKFFES